MRNKFLLVIGIMLFVLGQIGVNFLIYKYKNKNVEIPKVQLRESEKNKKDKSFAIMLEQNDGSYSETSSNSFNQPGYIFNSEKSGCIDINGNKIANSLGYNESTKSIGVRVNSTAYCYAYFDKFYGNTLITKANLNNEGGLYRYQGTTVNNYICFGVSDKNTCIGNTDKYMYRIMGVNSNGQMKLIKKEALDTTYAWHSDASTNTAWNNSDLYKGLNGSYFLNNTTYVPSGWSSRIATTNWKYGDNTNVNITASNLYSIESGWTNTVSAKIGLMYAHDYVYGLSGGNDCSETAAKYEICKTSWLHLSNDDKSTSDSSYEWTMSRYGYWKDHYDAWRLSSKGLIWADYFSTAYSARPVFFLNNTEIISSGLGTISDPYILM